jgi:hypothetical protein
MLRIKTVTDGPTCTESLSGPMGSRIRCKLPLGHTGPRHTADVDFGELSWEPASKSKSPEASEAAEPRG